MAVKLPRESGVQTSVNGVPVQQGFHGHFQTQQWSARRKLVRNEERVFCVYASLFNVGVIDICITRCTQTDTDTHTYTRTYTPPGEAHRLSARCGCRAPLFIYVIRHVLWKSKQEVSMVSEL